MKIKICIEDGCKNASTSEGYCRLHYVKNWKKIKGEKQKKAANRLNKYVEGICKKFPEKYVDAIRRDVRSDRLEVKELTGDPSGDDMNENNTGDFGFEGDESVDRLLHRIKIEKEF